MCNFTGCLLYTSTFKLGNKYAKALGLEYLDANNTLHPVEMGCYGLGLERTMASIVEQHHDCLLYTSRCV